MNKIILLLLALLTAEGAAAQYAYFATRGKISFDKITFTRARVRDMQQQMAQNSSGRFGGGRGFGDLENIPESTTEKYTLAFDENATLQYIDPTTPAVAPTAKGQSIQGGTIRAGQSRTTAGTPRAQGRIRPAGNASSNSEKVIFQNLTELTSAVQVQIDDKYIITDSLDEITWRFSDEYRNIAGYDCRRVNGATKDSLYLVAFYTDEIPLGGGPALSNGLPGMILGLIIPEMHIQYWATKVEITNELVENEWKDKKAKPLDMEEFVNAFGRYFQRGRDSNTNKRQIQEQLIY